MIRETTDNFFLKTIVSFFWKKYRFWKWMICFEPSQKKDKRSVKEQFANKYEFYDN